VSLAVTAAHHNAHIPTTIASFKAFLLLLKGCDGRHRRHKGYNGYDQKSLHRLNTAKGDPNCIPLAERAVDEYWNATLPGARKSGIWLVQQDVLARQNAVLGDHREFAETVNAYIEKKLAEE